MTFKKVSFYLVGQLFSDCEPHLKNVGELTMKMKLRKNKQKTARKQELNIQLFNRGYYFSLKKRLIRQYELIFVPSFAA